MAHRSRRRDPVVSPAHLRLVDRDLGRRRQRLHPAARIAARPRPTSCSRGSAPPTPELLTDDVRLATFPDDGLTSGALIAAVHGAPSARCRPHPCGGGRRGRAPRRRGRDETAGRERAAPMTTGRRARPARPAATPRPSGRSTSAICLVALPVLLPIGLLCALAHPARVARTDPVRPAADRPARRSLPDVQVPDDGPERRGAEGVPAAPQHPARTRLQDPRTTRGSRGSASSCARPASTSSRRSSMSSAARCRSSGRARPRSRRAPTTCGTPSGSRSCPASPACGRSRAAGR